MDCIIPNLTTSSALQLAVTLEELCPTDCLILDYSTMSNFDSFAMLFSGALIKSLRKRYPDIPFRFRHIKDKSYAGHMGYFQYIAPTISIGKAPGEASGSSSYIPITEINASELMREAIDRGQSLELGNLIESEAKRLAGIIAQDNRELKTLLAYLIREILRNTPEHADCDTMWICGQYWPSHHRAEIAILDEGIGIYNSIVKNRSHAEYIHSNRDALAWAIKAGISESFNPSRKPKQSEVWANSGYGLYTVSRICTSLGGSFCLASGSDYLTLYPNRKKVGKTAFNGTALMLSVSTKNIKNARQIITSIVKEGENEAKEIRNAFREASVPSKGLIEKLNIYG